jgi:hypothetical protein
MRANCKIILGNVVALALLSLPLLAEHQEKPSASSSETKPAAGSAPEMDKLRFYVGEWDYTETYPKSAFYPNGGKNTGVYKSRPGPGGNSLVNEFHSQGPVGDFDGLLLMTWDPREKCYKEYAFGNEFPGAIVGNGAWEGDTLAYVTEFSMGPTKLKLRNTTRLIAPGKLVSEEFSIADGKPEVLLVRVEATKR